MGLRSILVLALCGGLGCAGQKPAEAPPEPASAAAESAPAKDAKPAPAPEQPKAPSGPRAAGEGFSVPIPAGYRVLEGPEYDAVRKKGGVILEALEGPSGDGALLASVVITRIQWSQVDAKDPLTCIGIAPKIATSLESVAKKQGIVRVGSLVTCQVVVSHSKIKTRGATATILGDGAEAWLATCNYDTRDARAGAACEEVVLGFART